MRGRLRRANGGRAYGKFRLVRTNILLKHRNEMRGLAGSSTITGATGAAFAFTQDVVRRLTIYPELVRRNFATPWSEAERANSWCGVALRRVQLL